MREEGKFGQKTEGFDHADASGDYAGRTVSDEIVDLLEDGRNYVQAELAFQKTRAAFVADRSKKGMAFLVGALALVHLALIALVVGLVIALAPMIGPWGAMVLVVILLLAGAMALAVMAKARFKGARAAFGGKAE